MITDFLLGLLEAAAGFIIDLVPAVAEPTWVADASFPTVMVDLGAKAALFGIWVPWTIIAAVLVTTWTVRMGMATVQLGFKAYAMLRGGAT
jgi:hypothetical protein